MNLSYFTPLSLRLFRFLTRWKCSQMLKCINNVTVLLEIMLVYITIHLTRTCVTMKHFQQTSRGYNSIFHNYDLLRVFKLSLLVEIFTLRLHEPLKNSTISAKTSGYLGGYCLHIFQSIKLLHACVNYFVLAASQTSYFKHNIHHFHCAHTYMQYAMRTWMVSSLCSESWVWTPAHPSPLNGHHLGLQRGEGGTTYIVSASKNNLVNALLTS